MKLKRKELVECNEKLRERKRRYPYSKRVTGIGVNLRDGIEDTRVFRNNSELCQLKDLTRLIEELEMVRDIIAGETGLFI